MMNNAQKCMAKRQLEGEFVFDVGVAYA